VGLLTGTALFDSIRSTSAASAFWWLGQHTFIVKIDDTIVLIDPFLTELEDRSLPPLFEPSEAAGVVDVVACTHGHLDHIDPAAIPGLAEHTDARFVAPSAHEERMRSLGVPPDRLDVLDDGETASVAGLQFHAIKSAHEFFEQTDDGHFHANP
jgi:L-ascorbate metabolism protein UlaG (beta-lactamase superfamily)